MQQLYENLRKELVSAKNLNVSQQIICLSKRCVCAMNVSQQRTCLSKECVSAKNVVQQRTCLSKTLCPSKEPLIIDNFSSKYVLPCNERIFQQLLLFQPYFLEYPAQQEYNWILRVWTKLPKSKKLIQAAHIHGPCHGIP